MRRHHKRGTARFGCLRRFCLSTHSESFGVIRWPECDCVCAGVGLSGGRGRLLTHVHRASACTLNAVGLLPVSGCGDARVAPPCPTTLCVWRNLRKGADWRGLAHTPAHTIRPRGPRRRRERRRGGADIAGRILKIQASLTAHWHDKGADWRGLAHTQAHHRSRLSDSVKNGNALRTMHNAALSPRTLARSPVCHATAVWRTTDKR